MKFLAHIFLGTLVAVLASAQTQTPPAGWPVFWHKGIITDKPTSIYNPIDYCRKNFHNFKARGGNWTVEEDEDLAMLVEQHGKQWTKLSKELNRHPEDIRDRYRNYVICGQNLDRSGWTDDEERLLLRFVEEAREALRGPLRTRPIESTIDWQKISDEFGRSRSRLQCFTKWKRLQGE
ncbi:hypothetical protein BN1723_017809, partial [Verticillium longisporum]